MTLLVALGDSTSCGEGVGLRVPSASTWPTLLAQALSSGSARCLARPGARLSDVLREQREPAVQARADLATVLVGLNDVARGGVPEDADAMLAHLVGSLRDSGALVLLVRLHDPTRLLPLPPAVVRLVRHRVQRVNDAVDASVGPGVHVVDLQSVSGLEQRAAWAVDRLHPSAAGHAQLAAAAADVLGEAGLPVARLHQPRRGRSPGRLEELRWALRHGAPWTLRYVAGLAMQRGQPA